MNTQKTAIVTGGSRGIGRAISLRLASDGFAVGVNYVGQKAKADEVVSEIQQKGGRAIAMVGDVSKSEDAKRLFQETEQAFGPIGVLVNCAGVMTLKPIAEADDALFDRIFSINVRGTLIMMKQAVQSLGEGGRIINFSTSVIGVSLPGYGLYAASKAAVEVLTKTLANEMRGRKITVNAVAPGPTATELFFEGKTQEFIDRLAKMAPLERIGQPEEIASVVSFLAGPEGSWVNGQTIRVNGGYV